MPRRRRRLPSQTAVNAEAEEKTQQREILPRPALCSGRANKQHLVLRAGYGARSRWRDVDLFRGHPVFVWLISALEQEERELLDNPPQYVENGGLQRDMSRWPYHRGRRCTPLLAVGKLVISVKNTGKRLFAEIYGTSHGWDATRFKIDIERGILQVHEGCSGFSHRSGEQAWLKPDGKLRGTMDEVLWPFVHSLDVPPSLPAPVGRPIGLSTPGARCGDDASMRSISHSASASSGLFREWDLRKARANDRATMWAVVLCRHRASEMRAFARLPDAILELIFGYAFGEVCVACSSPQHLVQTQ